LSETKLAEILSLGQAVIQRLHAADRSGADELLGAQDTQTLRELREAAFLLEYHARLQLYARDERLYHTNRSEVLKSGFRP
jgi:hypothetical protein